MFPTVPGGDAGELLAEACHLGTAHPPGYPLFTILMYMVSEVGVNVEGWTPAAAANAACCFFGATTATVLSETTYRFVSSELGKEHDVLAGYAGALGGVLFAFSPLTWEYSVGAEVFALHNTLVAFILYFTVSVAVAEERGSRLVSGCLGALFCGLAISNQHTSILFIACLVPYVAFVIFVRGKERRDVFLTLMGAMFVLGLLPYLYLVWASGRVTDGSWGDMTSFAGFKKHVLREEYGTLKLAPSGKAGDLTAWDGMLGRTLIWLLDLRMQIGIVFLALAVYGMVARAGEGLGSEGGRDRGKGRGRGRERVVLKGEKKKGGKKKKEAKEMKEERDDDEAALEEFASTGGKGKGKGKGDNNDLKAALLLTLFFYVAIWNGVFSNLPLEVPMAYAVHSRFWFQPNMIMCMFAGLGFSIVLQRRPNWIGARETPGRLGVIVVLIAAAIVGLRYKEADRSDADFNSVYGKAMLDSIDYGSLLLSHTDLDWNTVRYLRKCEGFKPGIVHVSAQLLPYPWFQRQIDTGMFGDVVFPEILPGVSTSRFSEGNKVLLERFFEANHQKYPKNMFVDMQGISDSDIQPGGIWRGWLMIPHGLVYRVEKPTANVLNELPNYFREIEEELEKLQKLLVNVTPKYSSGSWEFACASVRNDAFYQAGLNFLTYGLEVGKALQKEPKLFTLYLDCLRRSTESLAGLVDVLVGQGEVALSYPPSDLVKNAALSSVKNLQANVAAKKIEGEGAEDVRVIGSGMELARKTAKVVVGAYLDVTLEESDPGSFRFFKGFYEQEFQGKENEI
ncbi:hypothetical protein TrST_g1522 [Triparma strigata]|nr:hypothetical protein TrST_g1522 [Triparma strigata]